MFANSENRCNIQYTIFVTRPPSSLAIPANRPAFLLDVPCPAKSLKCLFSKNAESNSTEFMRTVYIFMRSSNVNAIT